MGSAAPNGQPPPPRPALAALERTRFLLANALEISRELGGLLQPAKIMDTFLLMAMGPLGVTRGVVAMQGTLGGQETLVCRGMSPEETRDLRGRLGAVLEYFHGRADRYSRLATQPRLDQGQGVDAAFFLPGIGHVMVWRVEQDYLGLLALGDRFDGTPLASEDLDLISNLAGTLVASLTRALVAQNIEQLNAELEKQNDCLEKALTESKAIRRDLDRRVFHLKALHDLTTELSPLWDMDELLNSYLLLLMGAFGIGQGLILLHDRAARRVRQASRGFVGGMEGMSSGQAEALLFKCFEVAEKRTLAPMTINRLADTQALAQAGWATKGAKAFMFVLDDSCMGLLVLGPSISGDCLRPAEVETLTTHAATFLVFLKNARHLETVRELNQSLSQRNRELERTIADLTEAKHRITVLERAKAQIKNVIQHERERLDRATPLDFLVMLVFTALFGVLFNLASPNGIPLLPDTALRPPGHLIEAVQARELLEKGQALLVDARPKEFHSRRRIPGAVNLPSALFEIVYLMKFNDLDPGRPLIVYGRHVSRLYDEEVANLLRQRNHERVFVLAGGLEAWEAMNYPVEP